VEGVDSVIPRRGYDYGEDTIRVIDEEGGVGDICDWGKDGAAQMIPDNGDWTIKDDEVVKGDDGGDGIVNHNDSNGVVVTKWKLNECGETERGVFLRRFDLVVPNGIRLTF
jgi:hypothetical protein